MTNTTLRFNEIVDSNMTYKLTIRQEEHILTNAELLTLKKQVCEKI